MDRLVETFVGLNERVARELRREELRQRLNQMVLDGKLGYVPEMGEYIRLSENDGLFGRIEK